MRKLAVWTIVVFALLIGSTLARAAEPAQEKSYSADRFDVDITIDDDGSLLVTETVDYAFVGGPFTFVFRELNSDRTDGLEIIETTLDGRLYPPGDAAGQVEISGSDPVRVEWHFEPISDITRTFILTYRLHGVIRQEEGSDLLRFQPLPDDFSFPIQSSTITIRYPPAAALVGQPNITAGSGTVNQSDGTITIEAANISANQTLVVDVPFAPGSLIAAPPQWQARQAQGRALLPLWLASSFLVVIGSLIGAITLWWRNRPVLQPRQRSIDTPPTTHPPGVAGLLASGGVSVMWSHALATLFDLAGRGYVHIEEIPKKGWFNRTDFWITRENRDISDLHAHEIALLTLVFTDKNKGAIDRLKMSKLSKVVTSSRWQNFKEVLKNELKSSGYFNMDRERARKRFFIIGAVLTVIGGLLAVLTIFVADQTQAWPLFLAGGVFVAGFVFLLTGGLQSPLTDEGATIAAAWKQFFESLKSISRGKLTVDLSLFEKYLPFAAAAGLLSPWVKWFQKQEAVPLPSYFTFHSANPADGFVAFAALAATSSSSGGSSAGGAGAGAAGGGGAGAG